MLSVHEKEKENRLDKSTRGISKMIDGAANGDDFLL